MAILIITIIIVIVVIIVIYDINIVLVIFMIFVIATIIIIINTIVVAVVISANQSEMLRKKVASLEEAIQAKDRENVTNRTMYDNMKGVSRKIKEVSESVKRCCGAWKASPEGGVTGFQETSSLLPRGILCRLHVQQCNSSNERERESLFVGPMGYVDAVVKTP